MHCRSGTAPPETSRQGHLWLGFGIVLVACSPPDADLEPEFDDALTDDFDCVIDEDPGPAPQLLATGVPAPSAIDLDDTYVWFAAFADGSVGRVPRDGSGPPERFIDGIPSPTAVRVSGDWIFITTAPGSILRVDRDTAEVEEVVTEQALPQHLLVTDEELLWVNQGTSTLTASGFVPDGNAGLFAMPLAGDGTPRPLLSEQNWVAGFAVDDGVAFVAATGRDEGSRRIVAVTIDGQESWTVATVAGALLGVAVHDGYVYWTRPLACAVNRAPIDGGPVERIAEQENVPSFIVADELGIVWTNAGRQSQSFAGSQVVVAGQDGTGRRGIATGRNAYALVADGPEVYFSNNEFDGEIAGVSR